MSVRIFHLLTKYGLYHFNINQAHALTGTQKSLLSIYKFFGLKTEDLFILQEMKLAIISAAFCLILLISSTSGENPGFQIRLTSRGLNFGRDVALGFLKDRLKNLQVPEHTGDGYGIRNIRVTSWNLGSTTITTSRPNEVTLGINSAAATVYGDWRYWKKLLFFTLRDSGTVRVSTSISIQQTVRVGRSGDKPTFSVGHCTASIGHFDVHLSGGNLVATTFYRVILAAVKNIIKPALQLQICPQVVKILSDQSSKITNNFPTVFPLVFGSNVNLGLVANPAVTSDSFTLSLRGRCFPANNPGLSFPFNAPTTPVLTPTSQMARISISPYTMNTLLYSMWQSNLLRKFYSQQELSAAIGTSLTANVLADVFPALAQYGSSSLEAEVRAPEAPRVHITPAGIGVNGRIELVLYVVLGPGNKPQALTISTNVQVTVQPRLVGSVVSGTISHLNVAVTGAGGLPVEAINGIINYFLPSQILPALNRVAAAGFDIPGYYGFSVSGASIATRQNALEVGTDFRKAPPSTTQPPRTTTTLGPLGPICRSLRRIGPDGEIRPGPLC
ncbi:bactericidal permeability-increasing protein-like isoform X1 [Clavelina lepadiformis]|uniref:bactericidal permeability-increasing protein-like isoform X1 n=1 Tax=Clavelina lepadiformis TaxID=159417 RepID=UPI0040422D7F